MDGITTDYIYNGLGNRILVTTKNGSEVTSKKEYVSDITSTYQNILEVIDITVGQDHEKLDDGIVSNHSIFVYGLEGSQCTTQGLEG